MILMMAMLKPALSTLHIRVSKETLKTAILSVSIYFLTHVDFTIASNLTAIPMSYSSVLLQWVSNSINKFGFLYYNVKIEPHDIAGNCTEGTCNVTSTQLYLVNMKPLPHMYLQLVL